MINVSGRRQSPCCAASIDGSIPMLLSFLSIVFRFCETFKMETIVLNVLKVSIVNLTRPSQQLNDHINLFNSLIKVSFHGQFSRTALRCNSTF